MRLKITWTDSSSWPLPSAEAKLRDRGVPQMFGPGVEPSAQGLCALCVFLESQMNPGLPLQRDIASIRKPSAFYEAISGRCLGFSIGREFLRVKPQ